MSEELEVHLARLAAAVNGDRPMLFKTAVNRAAVKVALGRMGRDEAMEGLMDASRTNGHLAEVGEDALEEQILAIMDPIVERRALPMLEEPKWERSDLLSAEALPVQEATILVREDGCGMFYPGLLHGIHGESESGKSWLALAAVVWIARSGGSAIYVDFEDNARTMIQRLRVLGATDEEIGRIHHYSVAEGWEGAPDDLLQRYEDVGIVVLDGVSEGMGLLALDPLGTTDAVQWVIWARKWASTGAAVITIDHVVKDKNSQGRWSIGSQHKVAGAYVSYAVEPVGALRRGHLSKVRIQIAKDRPGYLREHGGAMSGRLQEAGVFMFGGSAQQGWRIAAPSAGNSAAMDRAVLDAERKDRIVELLKQQDEPLSTSKILEAVKCKKESLLDSLRDLVAEGAVERSGGSPGKPWLYSIPGMFL